MPDLQDFLHIPHDLGRIMARLDGITEALTTLEKDDEALVDAVNVVVTAYNEQSAELNTLKERVEKGETISETDLNTLVEKANKVGEGLKGATDKLSTLTPAKDTPPPFGRVFGGGDPLPSQPVQPSEGDVAPAAPPTVPSESDVAPAAPPSVQASTI